MSVKKIKPVSPPHTFEEYMHEISPLSAEEDGGFLITFPDLPGCMSDGATVEEAIANGRDAFSAWIAAVSDTGKPVPKPTAKPVELVEASGKFVARLPKTMHARLVAMARQEGLLFFRSNVDAKHSGGELCHPPLWPAFAAAIISLCLGIFDGPKGSKARVLMQ